MSPELDEVVKLKNSFSLETEAEKILSGLKVRRFMFHTSSNTKLLVISRFLLLLFSSMKCGGSTV